jgi:hypothetical protein
VLGDSNPAIQNSSKPAASRNDIALPIPVQIACISGVAA